MGVTDHIQTYFNFFFDICVHIKYKIRILMRSSQKLPNFGYSKKLWGVGHFYLPAKIGLKESLQQNHVKLLPSSQHVN